jgi:hypothetical protein
MTRPCKLTSGLRQRAGCRRWYSVLSRVGLTLAVLIISLKGEAGAQVNWYYRGGLSNNFRMELTLSGTPASTAMIFGMLPTSWSRTTSIEKI